LYVYDLADGAGSVVPFVPPVTLRSDYRPSMSADGRLAALAAEAEGQPGSIYLWEVAGQRFVDLPGLAASPNAQGCPSLSLDGRLLAFECWQRPGAAGRWDVLVYDRTLGALVDLPGLGTARFDERWPCLSGDGRWLATVTNGSPENLSEVVLYDVAGRSPVPLPGLNSPSADSEPSLNADGSLVAFVSDRPGGAGGRDIVAYDRTRKSWIDLAGLNSPAQEHSPAMSPGGRYILFVSERLEGAGERDVYLYDRRTQSLIDLPNLGSPRDEIDPAWLTPPSEDE
jgi:Tol biopolymer transport system component